MTSRRRARKPLKRSQPPAEHRAVSDPRAVSLMRRRGMTVWGMRPTAEERRQRRAEAHAEHLTRIAELPAKRERFLAATECLDAFDVLVGMQVYLSGQPELDESNLPERIWAPVELAAMLLLERPSAAAPTRPTGPIRTSVPELFDLLETAVTVTSAELCGYFERPLDDPLTEIHERFVRRLLIIPINDTYEQAQAQFLDTFADPQLDAWLAEDLGFTAAEALELARAVATLQIIKGIAPFVEARKRTRDGIGIGRAASFTVERLAAEAGTTLAAASGFVDCLAQPFGQPRISLPTLTTPMRHRPLLRDGDGRLLAAVPPLMPRLLRSIFTAIANPMIPTSIPGRRDVFDRLTAVRAAALERRAVTTIAERLRADRAAIGVRYAVAEPTGHLDGELDGVVELDGTAIVIQAKSGATRVDAVAGDPAEFRRVVRGIVTEAMRQHDDARRLLRTPAGRATVGAEVRTPVEGDVLPITVTLEDLSGCAPFSWQLRESGLATDGPLPWIAAIAQVEVILDLVDLPAQFVHFLKRRSSLNDVRLLQTVDETDIFLEYLHDRLSIVQVNPKAPGVPDVILPPERFHALGRYLLARSTGSKPEKRPRMRLHGGVRELLERLDRDRPAGWLTASLAILDIPLKGEERLGAAYLKLVRGGEPHVFRRQAPDGTMLIVVRLTPGFAIEPDDLASRARRDARSAGARRWIAIALPAARAAPILQVSIGERPVSAAA